MTGPPGATEAFGSGDRAFFTTTDGTWFDPTGATRGPWDPEACHAGPPTGLMARAAERAVPDLRLSRLCVDLVRPFPMAGFEVGAETVRRGRSVASTRVEAIDGEGRVCATGYGLHLAVADIGPVPSAEVPRPVPADRVPGRFPFDVWIHDMASFVGAGIDVGYPGDQTPDPGPTTLWMRTIPLLADETPSPFQRICPLADCGNAISRNAEPWDIAFVNADVTVLLFRDPVGEWLASSATSFWEPTGIGLADALLFDEAGPVGRACQSVLLRPER
jgi:hypothetical protein